LFNGGFEIEGYQTIALQKKESEPFNEIHNLLIQNLQLLKKHEVHIAIGSDSYRQTSLAEALNL